MLQTDYYARNVTHGLLYAECYKRTIMRGMLHTDYYTRTIIFCPFSPLGPFFLLPEECVGLLKGSFPLLNHLSLNHHCWDNRRGRIGDEDVCRGNRGLYCRFEGRNEGWRGRQILVWSRRSTFIALSWLLKSGE